MTWKPHATVAVVVQDAEGRFLLVEELSHQQLVYNQPAGHIEEHESIFEAACREALEETGWQVELTHLLGVYTYLAPANGATYYRFCFAATAVTRLTDQLDKDIRAAHWLDLDTIRARADQMRSPLVIRCIEDYLAGRRFPLDLIVETTGPGAGKLASH
ncbi:MAG: NUDIX hydrolase [Marinobacter sp.]|nr:NUDIX hydrolase [Marinobacter sp.]